MVTVLAVALILRGVVSLWSFPQLESDPDAYRALAENLSSTGVYGLVGADGQPRATAFRPPLYPYLLSWITVQGKLHSLAVALFHVLLGAITVVFTYLAARRLLGENSRPWAALIAAALVAADPILLKQSTAIMTETIAAALVSIILWCWAGHMEARSRGGFSVGFLLALAYLCRPTFLVWAALLSLALLVSAWAHSNERGTRVQQLLRGIVMGLLVLSAVSLWTLRNWRSLGHPIWATTHGGYTLLLGNNPSFYNYLRDGSFGVPWDPEKFFLAYSHRYDADSTTEEFWQRDWKTPGTFEGTVTEYEDDQVSYEAARATIRREPKMFFWSCLVRIGRLWSPIPHRTGDSWSVLMVAVGIFYSLVYIAMVTGLWRLGRELFCQKWWPVLFLAVTLSLVHAFYWSNLRMRAPIIPALAILAAAAIPLGRAEVPGNSSAGAEAKRTEV